MVYGQTRTFIDILKAMNEKTPLKNDYDALNLLTDYISGQARLVGDVTDFACLLLRNWGTTKENQKGINLAELEEALLDKSGKEYFARTGADEIYCRYCVSKLIHYIELLNEFRRYSSWQEIENDLRMTLTDTSCGGSRDFFSVSRRMLYETCWTIERRWDDVSENEHLSNEKLEKVFFKDFQDMVGRYGLDGTIGRAYTYQGCHPDWLIPDSVVGPFYFRTEDGDYRLRCGSHPMGADVFELRFASTLLRQSEDYVEKEHFFVPVRDFTLPVFHLYHGKVQFDNEEEKGEFIRSLLDR